MLKKQHKVALAGQKILINKMTSLTTSRAISFRLSKF